MHRRIIARICTHWLRWFALVALVLLGGLASRSGEAAPPKTTPKVPDELAETSTESTEGGSTAASTGKGDTTGAAGSLPGD